MSFEGYTCWEREDALGLLSTEALEGDDGLFLATHSPVTEFSVGGSNSTLMRSSTETALLEALAQRETRHTFCVIEGEPGSGKSHLIRWIKVNWPQAGDDLVLLIQRADGSLEGTLRQLQARLPSKYREIFDGIGPTRNVADEGKKQDFLTKIANSMSKSYFSDPPVDANWCEQHQIAHVLRHPKVFELWGAPKRVLQIIGGRGSKGGKRDQEVARFTVKDVVDLGQMDRSLRGLPLAAKRWTKSLRKESEEIQKLLPGHSESELHEDYSDKFPNSFALLHALERRLNNAIQELLGTTARQLDDLFLRLRRQLHSEGRRLVLLLEDVTNFQGVDEKLIDALVLNAATKVDGDSEICDLVSVLGVTPDYFHRYIRDKSNYFQRITLHIQLQAVKREEDGWKKEAEEFAVTFAARYLRAIRAGRERLKSYDGASPVYNRCRDCQHQSECHRFFGEVGV